MSFLVYITLGIFIGYVITKALRKPSQDNNSNSERKPSFDSNAFKTALLNVLAAEMIADGRVCKSELEVVKHVLVKQLGEEDAKNALLELRDILKSPIDLRNAAINIGTTIDYNSKLTILQILCDIASADGIVLESEVATLRNIAYNMSISNVDTLHIISQLNITTNENSKSHSDNKSTAETLADNTTPYEAYAALGISPDASDLQVKEAYRTLVKKYHPDRYASENEADQAMAAEVFKTIQTAYDKIRAARGL
ncbi:MAG: TerB family tellurite resistance protein [Bacteroidales bacterium]|nr:TerB family tellurite resistance protein [Bacteroidales bacterium]